MRDKDKVIKVTVLKYTEVLPVSGFYVMKRKEIEFGGAWNVCV